MKRLLLAVTICAGSAVAMPPLIPWQVYACDDGKALHVKRMEDGIALHVRLGGDAAREHRFLPENGKPGFTDGAYKEAGSDALLKLVDKTIAVTGVALNGAPYADCTATGETITPG